MNVLNTYNEFDSNHFELNVDHYGAEICDKGYSFGPSIRSNYVLHFIIEGQGTFTINNQTITLKEGDLFLLPKDQVTFYQADKEKPWTYIWVGFSGSRAQQILEYTQLLETYCLHSNLKSDILNQMLAIIQFADKPLTRESDLLMTGELYKLLAFLSEEFPNPSSRTSNNLADSYVEQALKIIHSQYHKNLKITDIANKLALSRSYLYRIFKEKTGFSLKDYLLKIKMNRSIELLSDPKLSISEVANSVGYTDSLIFSKVFKQYFKTSPTNYRKFHQEVSYDSEEFTSSL
ncbi:AraC family ligand binding domain-containing protein [Streptococcus caprae]|uniref:AraC family ligand binding domain-containing protein n=1 Tax=Streptococcus caprae TaxID=1640501 RepID=A0ABV8CWU5_9STRE